VTAGKLFVKLYCGQIKLELFVKQLGIGAPLDNLLSPW